MEQVLLDESVLRLDTALRFLDEGGAGVRVLLHRALLKLIEEKAFMGDVAAVNGLKRFVEKSRERGVEIEIVGDPSEAGRWREAAVELCLERGFTLLTSDPISAKIAEAMGVRCIYLHPTPPLAIEEVFTGDVMSLHMKEGLPPRIKRGHPARGCLRR